MLCATRCFLDLVDQRRRKQTLMNQSLIDEIVFLKFLFPGFHQRSCKHRPLLSVSQGSFPSTLESHRSTRHHGLVERVQRDRRFISPVRPYRNRQVSFCVLSELNPHSKVCPCPSFLMVPDDLKHVINPEIYFHLPIIQHLLI